MYGCNEMCFHERPTIKSQLINKKVFYISEEFLCITKRPAKSKFLKICSGSLLILR